MPTDVLWKRLAKPREVKLEDNFKVVIREIDCAD
jgi:hypothetical protein